MENLSNEIWKDIIGYEGLYQVSNFGNVKTIKRFVIKKNRYGTYTNQPVPAKDKIGTPDKNGYLKISLCKNSKCVTRSIHRIVAIAFIPNPKDKAQVNHIDENKTNNCLDNLEWCTNLENIRHGTGILRRRIACIRPVIQYDLNGNFIREWENYYLPSSLYGVSFKAISHAVRKEMCSAGFQWRKINKGDKIKPIAPYDNKGNRIIYQFDKNNHFIKKFNSMADAAMKTNIDRASINKVALGIRKSAGGFLWSYEAKEMGYSLSRLETTE